MPNLADFIERYLVGLLSDPDQEAVEIQRQEIARMFNCAPSQINYVLETRFTQQRGYVVESRRGGGGFIRIVRVTTRPQEWPVTIRREIGDDITARGTDHILQRLVEGHLLAAGEAALVRDTVAREADAIPPPVGDVIRAMLLRSILTVILTARLDTEVR